MKSDYSIEENVISLKMVLEKLGPEPSGPIYSGTHRQLAELLLGNGNDADALFHLCEGHGTTLRNQTCSRLKNQILRVPEKDLSSVKAMQDRLAFEGDWQNGYSGLSKRLSELPAGWTAVQLTLQWHPLSRFPPRNRDVNRGQGLYICRFLCGEESAKTNIHSVAFLPAYDVDENQLSLMTAMKENLSLLGEHRHSECSDRIQGTVREMERWIGGWDFLFLGQLMNDNLMRDIKSSVHSYISSYISSKEDAEVLSEENNMKSDQHLSEKVLYWLYLLASSPHIACSSLHKVLSTFLEDKNFALYMSKKVLEVMQKHKHELLTCKRHPVVLIIDEDLDILPFEIMSNLQSQVFTRVPSIHFLNALYFRHNNTTMKEIDKQKGYYVINPAANLPELANLYEALLSVPNFEKWNGLYNIRPSQDEFLKGLQENDVFLYCGHGAGNQYLPGDLIEKSAITAVVLLFGCSSSRLQQLGGRVEMSSLSYSYLIAGCPTVVGMLWQVLDKDVNAMTEELVKVWCGSKLKTSETVENVMSIVQDMQDLKICSSKKINEPEAGLCEAVLRARKLAKKFINKAAIVVRGLPVTT